MKKLSGICLAVISVLFITGCKTTSVRVGDSSKVDGLAYALPKTAFQLDQEITLVSCDKEALKTTSKFTLKERYVADTSKWYAIDTTELRTFLSKSKLDIVLNDNGTLKSINSVSEDKRLDYAVSIAEAIGGLASISIPKLDASETTGTREVKNKAELKLPYCNLDTIQLLDKQITEKGKTKGLGLTLEKSKLALTGCGTKEKPDIVKACKKVESAKVVAATKDLAANEKLVKTIDGFLKLQKSYEIPIGNSTKLIEGVVSPNNEVVVAWVNLQIPATVMNVISAELEYNYKVKVGAGGFDAISNCKEDNKASDCRAEPGIVYRLPVSGVFKLSKSFDENGATSDKSIISKEIMIPQGGHLEYISIARKGFESSTVSLGFAPNGLITTYSYDSMADSTDPAEAVKSIAEAARSYKTEKDSVDKSESLANLDFEIERITKIKELKDLRETL